MRECDKRYRSIDSVKQRLFLFCYLFLVCCGGAASDSSDITIKTFRRDYPMKRGGREWQWNRGHLVILSADGETLYTHIEDTELRIGRPIKADVDGDGRDDVIAMECDEAYCRAVYLLRTGNSFENIFTTEIYANPDFRLSTCNQLYATRDADRDGRLELAFRSLATDSSFRWETYEYSAEQKRVLKSVGDTMKCSDSTGDDGSSGRP